MKSVFTFIFLFSLAGSLAAQPAPVHGTVVDGRQPIKGASISVMSGDTVVAEARTGVDGTFDVALEPGSYQVEVGVTGDDKSVRTISVTPDMAPLSFEVKTVNGSEVAGPTDADTQAGELSNDDMNLVQELRGDFMPGPAPQASDDLVMNLLLGSSTADDPSVAVSGTVVDDRHVPVAGAGLVVKSGDKTVVKLKTSSQGIFDTALMPGQYTVEISVSGFEKTVQQIDITPAQAPLSFSIKSRKR